MPTPDRARSTRTSSRGSRRRLRGSSGRLVPPGAEPRWIETAVGRLRVLHAGAESPRAPGLLLHGGGSDNAAISWFRAIEALSTGREVWAVDLPGFGGSIDVPPVGGPADLARAAVAAMDALEVERAVLVGVSMGGDVALNVALDHPGRVAGLVLVGSGGLAPLVRDPRTHRWAWRAARLPDPLLLPLARLANRFVRSALRAMVHDPDSVPPEVVDEFVREARHPRSGIAYGRYNQATLARDRLLNDLTDRVAEIAVPTLLVHGAEDPVVDPEGSRRAAAAIPGAQLVLVPRTGHWAQLEAHEQFLVATHRLLEQVDRGSAPT